MAELIQFHCPVCGVMLRLPLAMAGHEGPCPRCSRPIVAPDPHRGWSARAIPRPVEKSPPFAEAPPVSMSMEAPAEPVPVPPFRTMPPTVASIPPPPAPETRRPFQTAVFILSILLTAVVSLVSGYLLGLNRFATHDVSLPPHLPQPGPMPVVNPEPPPKVVLIKPQEPPAVNPPVADPPPAPTAESSTPNPGFVQSSDAARAALKAFLDAPDWMSRSAHVLSRERVRSAMESYSHKVADGPTAYTSFERQDTFLDKETGATYFVFYVHTEKHPKGIPTVVAETKSGWLVDWEAFVEFRDEHFKSFAEGPAGQTGTFHLLVSLPPSPRAANTENEYFASFLIGPPGSEDARITYVKKNSDAHTILNNATKDRSVFAPVLEMAKRSTPDGKSYLEILHVTASNWLPRKPE